MRALRLAKLPASSSLSYNMTLEDVHRSLGSVGTGSLLTFCSVIGSWSTNKELRGLWVCHFGATLSSFARLNRQCSGQWGFFSISVDHRPPRVFLVCSRGEHGRWPLLASIHHGSTRFRHLDGRVLSFWKKQCCVCCLSLIYINSRVL